MSSVSKILVVVVHGQNCIVNEIWLYKPNLKTDGEHSFKTHVTLVSALTPNPSFFF